LYSDFQFLWHHCVCFWSGNCVLLFVRQLDPDYCIVIIDRCGRGEIDKWMSRLYEVVRCVLDFCYYSDIDFVCKLDRCSVVTQFFILCLCEQLQWRYLWLWCSWQHLSCWYVIFI
jgi:hypothetical protein